MPESFLPVPGKCNPEIAGFKARVKIPAKKISIHVVTFHSTTFDCGEMKRDKSERAP